MSAGEAAGQAQQSDAQQGGEAQGEQQGAPDFGAMMEQMQAIAQGQEDMRGYLQSQPWSQQQEPQAEAQTAEPQFETPQLDFLDSGDPEFDQQLAQNLQNLIQQQAQQISQQQMAPIQQDLAELRRERSAEALIGEFPELNEPERAQRVIGLSREYAEMMGNPELAQSPDFWRVMHLADVAMTAAKEEQENAPAAHLEGAGGAGAGQQPQVNPIDLIMNRGDDEGLGARVLNFGQ